MNAENPKEDWGALRPLSEIRDYEGLVQALRSRATELKLALSAEENAAVAGVAASYIPKLIGSNPIKRIGMVSLGALLGLTGSKLLLVVDEEAEQRYGPRLKIRNDNLVRSAVTEVRLTRRFLQKIGRKGARSRWDNTTPEQCSEVARQLNKLRWSKPRITEIKRAAT
jgi:hypothetical protein